MLAALDALFPRLAEAGQRAPGGFRVRMVGVTLNEMVPVDGEQGSLFAHLDPDDPLARETRGLALSRAMDRLNEKFGRHAVSLGPLHGGRIDRGRDQDRVRANPRSRRVPRISFTCGQCVLRCGAANNVTLYTNRLTFCCLRKAFSPMKTPLLSATAVALLALTACQSKTEDGQHASPNSPRVENTTTAATTPIELPPAIKTEGVVSLPRRQQPGEGRPSSRRRRTAAMTAEAVGPADHAQGAATAGQPMTADGGWALSGNDKSFSVTVAGQGRARPAARETRPISHFRQRPRGGFPRRPVFMPA